MARDGHWCSARTGGGASPLHSSSVHAGARRRRCCSSTWRCATRSARLCCARCWRRMSLSNRTSAIQHCRCELEPVCACAHARARMPVRPGGCAGVGACVPVRACVRSKPATAPLASLASLTVAAGVLRARQHQLHADRHLLFLPLVTGNCCNRAAGAAVLWPPRLCVACPACRGRGFWCRSVLCARKLRPHGSACRCKRC